MLANSMHSDKVSLQRGDEKTATTREEFLLALACGAQHTCEMQIHIARNGQAMGPFSLEEVNRQLAAGTLTGTDLAWYEGAAGWAPLSSVPGVRISGTTGSVTRARGASNSCHTGGDYAGARRRGALSYHPGGSH